MKTKVIVIGHGYTSRLSIIRSVAEIGCEVTIISMVLYRAGTRELDTVKPIDAYSKYVTNVYYCYRKGETELVQLLLEKCREQDQKPIIIPDTDFTAATIDKYKEQLSPFFLFPHIREGKGTMLHWMDKVVQKQLAREVGLRVADSSTIIEIKDGHFTVPRCIKYPCFTKPLATISGGKVGMSRCDNEGELLTALNILRNEKNVKVLVEDFKIIDKEYAVLGFTDGNDVIIPGAIQQLIVSKKNKGIAMTGQVMPADTFGPLIEQFKQFVLATGFIGIFDIDFYYSEGEYYFCEMNLRFGGSGYAVTKMGVNLPAMMVKHLSASPVSDMPISFSGTSTYVNERMCMDDWQNLYITTAELHDYINEADIQFLRDDEDPEPRRQFVREYNKIKFKRFVKLCLRKLRLK